MTTWTKDELNKIGTAEELDLSSLRSDGTLRKPVTIWVVRIGDDLFVRAYKGRNGPWFRGTQSRHEGHIQSGGIDRDVTFEDESDTKIIGQIDAAFRSKYRHHDAIYVDPMVTPEAREATIKLVPR
jgi:hypothetical protein